MGFPIVMSNLSRTLEWTAIAICFLMLIPTGMATNQSYPASSQTVYVTPHNPAVVVGHTQSLSLVCSPIPCTGTSWSLTSPTGVSYGTIVPVNGDPNAAVFTATTITPGSVVVYVIASTLVNNQQWSANAYITVIAGSPLGVSITPSQVTVKVGGIQKFSAALTGCSGTCTTVSYSWSLQNTAYGKLDSLVGTSVNFTATAASSSDFRLSVTATVDNGGCFACKVSVANWAFVSVLAQQPDRVTIASAVGIGATLQVNQSIALTSVVTCEFNTCPPLSYLWYIYPTATSTTTSLGTLNATNRSTVMYTAPTTIGNVSIGLSVTGNDATCNAAPFVVTVIKNSNKSAPITVSNSSVSIAINRTSNVTVGEPLEFFVNFTGLLSGSQFPLLNITGMPGGCFRPIMKDNRNTTYGELYFCTPTVAGLYQVNGTAGIATPKPIAEGGTQPSVYYYHRMNFVVYDKTNISIVASSNLTPVWALMSLVGVVNHTMLVPTPSIAGYINWTGLPTGCTTSASLVLICTPTVSGTYTIDLLVKGTFMHRCLLSQCRGGAAGTPVWGYDPFTLTVFANTSGFAFSMAASPITFPAGTATHFYVNSSVSTNLTWTGLPSGCTAPAHDNLTSSGNGSIVFSCVFPTKGLFSVNVNATTGSATYAQTVELNVTAGQATGLSTISTSTLVVIVALVGIFGGIAVLAFVLMRRVHHRSRK